MFSKIQLPAEFFMEHLLCDFSNQQAQMTSGNSWSLCPCLLLDTLVSTGQFHRNIIGYSALPVILTSIQYGLFDLARLANSSLRKCFVYDFLRPFHIFFVKQ